MNSTCIQNIVFGRFVLKTIYLTLSAPGFWILVISRGGAQSARIQFKGSKLLLNLETLYMLSEI